MLLLFNISFLHAPLDHTGTAITHDMDRVSLGVAAAVETGDRAPALRAPRFGGAPPENRPRCWSGSP